LERWFARRGLPRSKPSTVEEYIERLIAKRHALKRPLAVIARSFCEARYGRKPIDEKMAELCFQSFLKIARSE
jgi:hypothetical protein